MPQKINMFISNGNIKPAFQQQNFNNSNLVSNQSMPAQKTPSSLKAPILSRIHNVRPGCGSCGRH
jgi:hypothetical protein